MFMFKCIWVQLNHKYLKRVFKLIQGNQLCLYGLRERKFSKHNEE